jgi:hypothetical protein
VNDLAETDLKYLVWRITNTHSCYDISHGRRILYSHFASLNIGYFLSDMRKVRNYIRVKQIVEIDVRNHANGVELYNYLKNVLSESQTNDVYNVLSETNDVYLEIIGNHNNPENNDTYQREFQDWFDTPGLMTHKQFVIHCHFAELEMGYYFRVQTISRYYERFIQRRSRERETHRIQRERTVIVNPDLLTIIFINNNNPYPIQQQIDYPLYKIEEMEKEEDSCCAVCMETKNKKERLITECNHEFCSLCIGQIIIHSIESSKKIDCPLCRSTLTCFKYYDETSIHHII